MSQSIPATRVPELDPAWTDDDEIDLFELARALWEGKPVILGVMLAAIAAVAGYLWTQTPVYESRGAIEIGHVPTIGAVHDPFMLVREMEERNGLAEGSRNLVSAGNGPRLVAVDMEIGGDPGILVFTARGEDPEQTTRFLEESINQVLSEHQSRYDNFLVRLETALQQLTQREAILEEQRDRLLLAVSSNGRVELTRPGVDATLAIQAARLSTLRLQLIDERARLESALLAGDNSPSRWLAEPTTSPNPVAPRSSLWLGLGAVGGLLTGMALALLIRGYRRRAGR